MPINYRTATYDILRSRGAPRCQHCKQPMAPADDHGRFVCFCQGVGAGIRDTFDAVTGTTVLPPRAIPQVDTTGMTDAQKAKVPAMSQLHDTPTAAEAKLLDIMLKGPGAMDDPEYAAAHKAVNQERAERN